MLSRLAPGQISCRLALECYAVMPAVAVKDDDRLVARVFPART